MWAGSVSPLSSSPSLPFPPGNNVMLKLLSRLGGVISKLTLLVVNVGLLTRYALPFPPLLFSPHLALRTYSIDVTTFLILVRPSLLP